MEEEKDMKKVICLILCTLLVLSVAGCGSQSGTSKTDATKTDTAATDTTKTEEAKTDETKSDATTAKQDPVTLKLAVMVAIGTPGDKSAVDFKNMIEEKSNGLIKIDYYPGGQLGSNDEVTEQLLTGTLDLAWNTLDWYAKLESDWNVLGLGFCIKDKEHLKAFLESDKNTEIKEHLLNTKGIRILTDKGIAYPRVVISKFPVNTVNDLAGKNMRVPELTLYVKTWKALGVNCVTLASGDMYMGLKQGIVDATEFPLGSIYGMKLHEAANYITYTNHLYAPYVMGINENSWRKFTPEMQDLLMECAEEAAKAFTKYDTESVETNVQKMIEEGAIVNENPDLDSFTAKLKDTAAECEEEGLWSKGLYEYVQNLRK